MFYSTMRLPILLDMVVKYISGIWRLKDVIVKELINLDFIIY